MNDPRRLGVQTKERLVFGTVKKLIGKGVATVEKATTSSASLPAKVLSSRVVLVGASVSEFWHVDVLYPCVTVEAHYSFDKTPVIEQVLARVPRPDAVIVKQCAAYFPIPLEPRKEMVLGWLDQIRERGAVPIVATVVPVTAAHDRENPDRLDGIIEYNDWIREVGEERGLPLLDLDEALRKSQSDPQLDERWATRDGLHLRRRAYRNRLDPLLAPVLIEALAE